MANDTRRTARSLGSHAAGARHAAHLRALNIDRVLSVAMDRPGTFTRAELIEATGLSAPTVGTMSARLIKAGVITDLGTAPSRGGRRPSLMEFNARHGYIAGVDLGPTRTRFAVGDLRGVRLAQHIAATPTADTPAAVLDHLAGTLRGVLRKARVPLDRLLMVVAGVPGAVDIKRDEVVLAPNLHGWRDVPMRCILQKALGGTSVLVENDVNLALLGEHWQGAARGHRNCVFIFVGTGIGAAILIDGELHRGNHFMAGEIAMMCMGPEYVNTDFGPRGCLESLAGLDALRARWPRAPRDDPGGWLTQLIAAAESGDLEARHAVEETARLIGIATANVVAVVDPSLIVLGGAMFAQAGPLVGYVRDVVERIARTPFQIVLSELGKEAPLAGCLLVAASEARKHLRQQLRSESGLVRMVQ
ncbi:MAG TPA: ROK family transcriptional regulator [Vicinamibacterales bacterium]|nr:ROK family transcriptional regulator [Vicinamibacterales bacterium]